MDKKMYINGVDISGCEFCCENPLHEIKHSCNVRGCEKDNGLHIHLQCKNNPNCYYKQLQRLKDELRTEKIYSSQIEELEGSLQHAKAENDRLKQEWRLDCLKCEYKNTKADVDKYKQALQDIREIVSKIIDSYIRPYGDFDQLKNILAKINEVIGEVDVSYRS